MVWFCLCCSMHVGKSVGNDSEQTLNGSRKISHYIHAVDCNNKSTFTFSTEIGLPLRILRMPVHQDLFFLLHCLRQEEKWSLEQGLMEASFPFHFFAAVVICYILRIAQIANASSTWGSMDWNWNGSARLLYSEGQNMLWERSVTSPVNSQLLGYRLWLA